MNSLAKTLACGSCVLAVVVAASMSGCSSSDSNTGGGGTSSGGSAGSGTAGSAAGTKNGAAGAADGGSGGSGGSLGSAGADTTGTAGADTTGMAGDTGSAGAGAEGSAVAKFCNEVSFGNDQSQTDITLVLEIGTAPNVVSFSALTGTCVPMTGPCSSIPVGVVLPVRLIDPATDNTVLDEGTLTAADGKEYVFYADVPTDAPIIEGGSITAGGPACSDFTYADLPQ
jgi:hypothetical protein